MWPRFYISKGRCTSGIRVVEDTPNYKEVSVGPKDTSEKLQDDIAEMYKRGSEDDDEDEEDEDPEADEGD
jgi:hypothetical protein